ncbi:MAG: YdcF family protein [Chitinophagaceae bacterium]
MMAALRFLEVNERYNAADYEPMTSTVNKAAVDRIKKINWNDYKYSVIVIPGAGPEDPKVPLSAEGLLRCRIAAQRYFEGLAPFIIPSGGRVHPYKTIYNEAYEMKKYLMEQLKVPENAIIMDPHARHTTTNLRNAARLIFRYGIPFDKVALTSTSRGQSMAIGTTLADRCQKELNIIPFKIGNRLSVTEVEFYPLPAALSINPYEPLDP